jgi:PAS domain S-box-containing protein
MTRNKPDDRSKQRGTLRQQAEELLRIRPADRPTLPTADVQALIQQLNVHQIELEIQNEELRNAQVELSHTRDRYADLYKFAPVGYVTLNKDGKILEANLTAATMLGVDRLQLLNSDLSRFICRESQDDFFLHRRAVFSSNKKQTCEIEIHRADSTALTVRLESIAFQIDHQRHCRTALIDITQQKQAELALRKLNLDLGESLKDRSAELQKSIEQIKLLSEAIAHLGEGVLITDDHLDWPGPHILFVNDALCRITGYTAEELIGKSPRMLQGEETDREVLDRIGSRLAAGDSVLVDLINFRKDGTAYDAELFITPLTDDQGCRTHFVSIHRDITERKRRERILREREERLRAVLNTASDAIVNIDKRGIITDINSAAERMFGYREEELVGRNVKILMPQPYSSEHDDYIKRYLETGERRIIGIGRELFGKRKDGSTFSIDLSVSEVDHLDLFTGIIRDISEYKMLQRDILAIAEDEQRRIGQDLHDGIQQQLTGIELLAQTLLNKLTREPGDLPKTSTENCRAIAKRILDGLVLAHQEVQRVSRGLVPITLDRDGLQDALHRLALSTDQAEGVSCAFKCEQPISVSDCLVATHLYRIAQEAVANAMKHASPEHILIALESADGKLTLQVADDGCGFDSSANSDGMGLKTMRYRAGLFGGNLTITPIDTGGTLVECVVFNNSLGGDRDE